MGHAQLKAVVAVLLTIVGVTLSTLFAPRLTALVACVGVLAVVLVVSQALMTQLQRLRTDLRNANGAAAATLGLIIEGQASHTKSLGVLGRRITSTEATVVTRANDLDQALTTHVSSLVATQRREMAGVRDAHTKSLGALGRQLNQVRDVMMSAAKARQLSDDQVRSELQTLAYRTTELTLRQAMTSRRDRPRPAQAAPLSLQEPTNE